MQSDSTVPLATSDECFVYIRAIDLPTHSWYAFHETLPILTDLNGNEKKETMWAVESGFFVNDSSAVSLTVHSFINFF